MSEEIIFGIDPGTLITGFGIIKVTKTLEPIDYGCIRPPSSKRLTERYKILFEAITTLLRSHKPHSVAIETQYVSKNVQSSLKLGMARGVITLAATLQQIPVFEYAPSKAKLAVVGSGRASKHQVQSMVTSLLRLTSPPTPEDAADALALAICHAHTLSKGWEKTYRM